MCGNVGWRVATCSSLSCLVGTVVIVVGTVVIVLVSPLRSDGFCVFDSCLFFSFAEAIPRFVFSNGVRTETAF